MLTNHVLRFLLLIGTFLTGFGVISKGQEIEVITYNIHHGADVNEHPTLDSMGKYIQNTHAQIVGLQEVDSVCIRSGKRDQPAVLSEWSGLESHFTRHFPYEGGAYGQGLLTKYPVTKLQNISLPIWPLSTGKHTSMLVADIRIAPKKEITVAVVHLDYRDQASRMHQIDKIWKYLQNKNKNLILMGDMNATPDSPELKELLKYFDRFLQKPEPYSFPAKKPDRRIDFVFIRKDSDLRITQERVDHVPYSDHLPVITTIEYK